MVKPRISYRNVTRYNCLVQVLYREYKMQYHSDTYISKYIGLHPNTWSTIPRYYRVNEHNINSSYGNAAKFGLRLCPHRKDICYVMLRNQSKQFSALDREHTSNRKINLKMAIKIPVTRCRSDEKKCLDVLHRWFWMDN